jgi:threonine dehydrogenase-like Zn-dependent dehydrogenase
MLAVSKPRPGPGIELVDVPRPVLGGGHEVLVEVAACGVCGSDLQYFRWEGHGTTITTPVILGHEAAGVVVLAGVLTRQPVTWVRAIRMLRRGAIDLGPLITHRLPLRDARSGFEALDAGRAIKVVLEPGRTMAEVRE